MDNGQPRGTGTGSGSGSGVGSVEVLRPSSIINRRKSAGASTDFRQRLKNRCDCDSIENYAVWVLVGNGRIVRCDKMVPRSRQDSNLRGQSPMDFESIALTTRPPRLGQVYGQLSVVTMMVAGCIELVILETSSRQTTLRK